MRLFGVCAVVALSLAVSTAIAVANAADPAAPAAPPPATSNQPTAMNVIFDRKHMSNVDQGTSLGYHFDRTPSDPKLLGEKFSDEITMKVTGIRPTGEKDVDLQIYTGDHARELQKIPSVTINPDVRRLLRHVGEYAEAAHGGEVRLPESDVQRRLQGQGQDRAGKGRLQRQDASMPTASPWRPTSATHYAKTMQGYDVSKFTLVVSNARARARSRS